MIDPNGREVPAVNPPQQGRSSLRRVVGILFGASALAFLTLFVIRNVEELRDQEWSIRPVLLLASLGLNICGLVFGVVVWRLLLRRMHVRVSQLALSRIWFLSSLGRYIPGKIWQFVGAAQMGAGVSMPASITVATLAAHSGYFTIGAFFLAVYLLPAEALQAAGLPPSPVRWIAPVALLLAHPGVVRTGLRAIKKAGGHAVHAWTPSWGDGLMLVALSLLSWSISGVALYLFILSLTPTIEASLLDIIGINALTFIFGYAIFFAPAGIGAKEGALTLLLSLYMPASAAAVIAIASRLWSVAADVVPAAALFWRPFGSHVAPPPPPPPRAEADES